ncbi:PH domain-containing protein [Roseiconus lacunae]|uniref:PH domain-containing protein n=1 Tax=Roseiconus lacunae TaxID=2605694 RepID=UPI0011F26A2A|nr:PH domain-containing protein [Roseiconus lacunae]
MNESIHAACTWCYEGVWSMLTNWFRVPRQPPTLPVADDTVVTSFRPSDNYLRYLKLFFWIGCVAVDIGLAILWIVIAVASPLVGVLITPLMLFVMIVPDIVAYVAIHLKFDTMWYVLSDRSMRIRRGIWVIHETTITFENIQNVRLTQGPIERYFGFANLVVETAGGGASAEGQSHGQPHQGIMVGLANASELRDCIMDKARQSQSAGLGDDRHDSGKKCMATGFTDVDVALLAEIRNQIVQLPLQNATGN